MDRRDLNIAAMGQGGMIGAESEPNNDPTTANAINGGASGEINPADDADFFSFTVPEGGSIYALTTDGNGSCNFDSVLTLIAPDGVTELGEADEGGPVNC